LKNIQFILGGIAFIFVEFLAIPQSIDTKPKEEYALILHRGVIAIEAKGKYRGYIKSDGQPVTLIYKNE
jgi:hypothetical protein